MQIPDPENIDSTDFHSSDARVDKGRWLVLLSAPTYVV